MVSKLVIKIPSPAEGSNIASSFLLASFKYSKVLLTTESTKSFGVKYDVIVEKTNSFLVFLSNLTRELNKRFFSGVNSNKSLLSSSMYCDTSKI